MDWHFEIQPAALNVRHSCASFNTSAIAESIHQKESPAGFIGSPHAFKNLKLMAGLLHQGVSGCLVQTG